MICKNCGKNIKCVGEITEEEIAKLEYINCKERSVETALQSDIVEKMEMDSDKVYSYFLAVYTLKAEVDYLRYMFFRELSNRIEINPNDMTIENGKIYVHGE